MNKVYKSTRLFKRSFLIIRNSAFNLILTFNIVFCIKAGRGGGLAFTVLRTQLQGIPSAFS